MVLGALIGAFLGLLSPALVQWFVGDHPSNRMRDGVALGILGGVFFGFLAGIVVVAAIVLSDRKQG